MKFASKIKRLFEKDVVLYDSFDSIKINNFRKVVETGNLKFLIKTEGKKPKDFHQQCNLIWNKIYDEYIHDFGLGKHRKNIMKQEDKVARMKILRWTKNDKSLTALIKIEERRLEDMKKKHVVEDKATFEYSVAVIQQHVVTFNLEQTTAKQYYTYAEIHQKEQDRLRVESIKRKAG